MTHDNDYQSTDLDLLDDSTEEIVADDGLTPEDFQRFLAGEVTWGELQGLTMEDAYAIADLGHKQMTAGRLGEAQAIFEGLVVSNPYDAYFHNVLGCVYAKKKMHPEAIEEFTIAIDLDPTQVSPYTFRAELLLQHGEFDRALKDLRKVDELDPDSKQPQTQRARALASATASILQGILGTGQHQAMP